MIIWLASYPRSGNTLLRMMLKSVFGRETYSKYNDLFDIGADEKTKELVGHGMLEAPWEEETYQKMKRSDLLFFTKTHDYPEDDSKAVYIVRDGRASIASYLHYLKDFNNMEYPLADIVAGYVRFGSWGSHLDAWNPLERPNTILVKYESLLSDSEKEIKRLSDFLGLTPSGHWNNDFEQFHKINPKFFREGTSKKDHEMKGEDLDLFLLFHGDWMNVLGYDKKDRASTQICYHLRRMTSRTYKKFEDSQAEYNKINSEKHKLVEEKKALITENTMLTVEKDKLAAQRDEQIKLLEERIKEKDALINELQRVVDEKEGLFHESLRDLKERDEQIKRLQEQSVQVEERVRKLQEQSSQVEEKISQLHGQIKEQEEMFRKKSGELIAERRRLETKLNQRDERIADLLRSWSWKITKPLRTFGDLFREKW